jgi:O-antigen/teichoic acid export membrane protein
LSLLKKLAGETVIYGVSNVVSRLINFLLVPYYTRVLVNTADYGVVNVMYGYVGLLLVIMTYRMETGFFRFGAKKENRDKVFSTSMISLMTTTPIFVTLLIIFSQDVANLIQYPDSPRYVIWFALIIGMDALTRVPLAKLRLDSRPKMFLAVQLTNIFVNVGANIFFITLCPILLENGHEWVNRIYNPDRLVDYVFISNLLASAVMLLMLLPSFLTIKREFDKNLFKRIFWYVLPLIPVGIAAIINETLDKPLLEWLLPGTKEENLAQVGIYAANYKLAALMTIITQGFNYAAEPFFFRNKERSDTRKLYGRVGQAFALLGSLAFLGIMLFVDVALMVLGDSYTQTGSEIIPIILMANLFLGLYYNFAIWYKLSDRTIMGMYIALVGAGITLGMNFLLIPHFGYIASAWATFACYAVMSTLAYILGQKYYPIDYPIKRMAIYILMALACYFVHIWLNANVELPNGWNHVVSVFILLTYIAVIYWMERDQLIREFLKKEEA